MKLELKIPDYQPEKGITLLWELDFKIHTKVDDSGAISIIANQDGLISLATHLLTLAQSAVPVGAHIHYDVGEELEADSCEMILGKIE